MYLPDLMRVLNDDEGLMYFSVSALITVALGPESLAGYRNSTPVHLQMGHSALERGREMRAERLEGDPA
ncbi:hypothetical protein [Streptomyces zaomyceticus]|uniref:hypothetical protein n=1 Tax=Streptomyces zaomyceticus TaxID=68286 RepID=UPI0036B4B5FA